VVTSAQGKPTVFFGVYCVVFLWFVADVTRSRGGSYINFLFVFNLLCQSLVINNFLIFASHMYLASLFTLRVTNHVPGPRELGRN
jgi:hypothetical protein